jgi:hypothetical protein
MASLGWNITCDRCGRKRPADERVADLPADTAGPVDRCGFGLS